MVARSAVGGAGLAASMRYVDISLIHVSITPYTPAESVALVVDATAGPIVIDLDGAAGGVTRVEIKKKDSSSNAVILSGTVDGDAGGFSLLSQDETVVVRRDGVEWWIMS